MKQISPIAMFFSLNRLLTLFSYGVVPVSLVHTIKASMPLFNVILSSIILQQSFSFYVYISLIPIVSGVIMSSVSEVEFDIIGFVFSLLSCIMAVSQNIYTKKVLISGFDKYNV